MSAPPAVHARPMYCPNCGYDLRAATGPVCSECGAKVGAGISSRLPWMQRRWRGVIPAYLATLWLVLRRPSLLVEEMQWRVPARDPRRFMAVNIVLASALLTGLCAVAFAFRGSHWVDLLPDIDHIDYSVLLRRAFDQWTLPLFVLGDSWLILIPVFLTTWVTLWFTQWIYRFLLVTAAGDSRHRRRLSRAATYLSALMVWAAACLGTVCIAAMIQFSKPDLPDPYASILLSVQLLAPLLLLIIFLGPSISLIARTSRPTRWWKWFYWLLMLWFALLLKIAIVFDESLNGSSSSVDGAIKMAATFFFAATLVGLVLTLILWKWRWQTLRIVYLMVVYPVLHLAVFAGVAAGVFWACGFAALAIGSMLHR